MALFDQNSPGILGKVGGWMTPERGMALSAIGQGLSQMSMGQPADLSNAMMALQDRQQKAQMRDALEGSGVMSRFTPEQRALLASMPPSAAMQIISGQVFREPEAPKVTDDMAEYNAAKAQGYMGTLQDWILDQRKAGASNQTVTVGGQKVTPIGTKGDILVEDPTAPGGYRVVQAEGSEAEFDRRQKVTEMASDAIDRAEKSDKIDSAALTASESVTAAAARAREAAQGRNVGSALTTTVGNLPWTDSAEVVRQVTALKDMASVENLNAMRAASPTGGALGNVTERELKLLANKTGALDPNSPNFERDLNDYERTLLRTIHGKEAGDAIYEQTRGDKTPDFGKMTDEELDDWIRANGG